MSIEFNAPDGRGAMHTINIIPRTLKKIELAKLAGAEIIVNTNWRYTGREKKFLRVKKLSQTNLIMGGKPKHIIWACYRATV